MKDRVFNKVEDRVRVVAVEARIDMDRAVVAEAEVMAVVMVPDRVVVASIDSNFKAGKANIKYVDYEPSYKFTKRVFR